MVFEPSIMILDWAPANADHTTTTYTVKKTFGFRGLGRLEYQGHTAETDACI